MKQFLIVVLMGCSSLVWAQAPNLETADAVEWTNDAYLSSNSCFSDGESSTVSLVVSNIVSRYMTKNYVTDVDVASYQLVQDYLIASLLVNRGNLCLAQAMGLKEVEEELLHEQQILLSGTSVSKKEVKRHRKIATSAASKIEAAADKLSEMAGEKKRYFSIGSITYLLGIVQTVRIKQSFDNVLNATTTTATSTLASAKSGGIQGLGRALAGASSVIKGGGGVLKVSKGIPKHLSNLVASGNTIVKYSEKYDVPLGEDVTSEFANVLGFGKNSKKGAFGLLKKVLPGNP